MIGAFWAFYFRLLTFDLKFIEFICIYANFFVPLHA